MNNRSVPRVNQVILVMSFILILECQTLQELSSKYIPEYFWKYPNIYKLGSLLDIPLISKLAKFVKEGLKLISQDKRVEEYFQVMLKHNTVTGYLIGKQVSDSFHQRIGYLTLSILRCQFI